MGAAELKLKGEAGRWGGGDWERVCFIWVEKKKKIINC
jgi:hypothetical protein